MLKLSSRNPAAVADATTAAVEQARQALAEAEAAAVREQHEAQREAERQAQADWDRSQTPVVAEVERQTAEVLASAAGLAVGPISRDATMAALRYLLGVNQALETATKLDPCAAMLAGHVLAVGATYERLASYNSPRYRAGDRRIGPELAQRIADCERATWGALLRRLRVLAGE